MFKMKKLTPFILCFVLTLISACNTAPENRPTLLRNTPLADDTEDTEAAEQAIEEERLKELARPDNAVKIQTNYCACKEAKPISFGSNCEAFCATKTASELQMILYMNVAVTSDISNRADLGNFTGWCNNLIVDVQNEDAPVGIPPSCSVELKDSAGSVSTYLAKDLTSTSLSVVLDGIELNKTYRLKVTNADGNVSSDTVQIRITEDSVKDPVGGPLGTVPTSRYSCMNITTSTDGVSFFYEEASRLYFNFTNESRPDPLSGIFANIFCHDRILFGNNPVNDPLLEETPGAFHLWDLHDPRFVDTDGNGQVQIDDLIMQSVRNQGVTLSSTPNLFFRFQWATGPKIDSASQDGNGDTSGQAENVELGYYMTPWTDNSTFKSYCPTQAHYYGSNPVFIALREYVGVDTEALYVAQEESKSALLLVRESEVKPLWFYRENGQNIEPDENSIRGKKVQFYWPPDPSSPFIKESHQRTFTVKRAQDIGDNVSDNIQNDQGVPTEVQAHDKRIGCVPKL
jgi:hypothetical protein